MKLWKQVSPAFNLKVFPWRSVSPVTGSIAYRKRSEMDTSRTQLVAELQELSHGLKEGSTLILKQVNGALFCQFLSHGLVIHTTTVSCHQLVTALWQVSSLGIIDGADFMIFRNVFDKFSLHVKARQLYAELGMQQPDMQLDLQSLLVA